MLLLAAAAAVIVGAAYWYQGSRQTRGAMKGIVLNGGFEEVYLRASFGLAQLQPEESVAAWLRRADVALYQAKERGRDCVVAAD